MDSGKEKSSFEVDVISDELKKGVVERRVSYILKDYSKTRSSDKVLIIAYMMIWHKLHKKIGKEAMNIVKEVIFKEMPSFETITRSRRKLQEAGLYLPPADVIASRAAEEAAVRDWSVE